MNSNVLELVIGFIEIVLVIVILICAMVKK